MPLFLLTGIPRHASCDKQDIQLQCCCFHGVMCVVSMPWFEAPALLLLGLLAYSLCLQFSGVGLPFAGVTPKLPCLYGLQLCKMQLLLQTLVLPLTSPSLPWFVTAHCDHAAVHTSHLIKIVSPASGFSSHNCGLHNRPGMFCTQDNTNIRPGLCPLPPLSHPHPRNPYSPKM